MVNNLVEVMGYGRWNIEIDDFEVSDFKAPRAVILNQFKCEPIEGTAEIVEESILDAKQRYAAHKPIGIAV